MAAVELGAVECVPVPLERAGARPPGSDRPGVLADDDYLVPLAPLPSDRGVESDAIFVGGRGRTTTADRRREARPAYTKASSDHRRGGELCNSPK